MFTGIIEETGIVVGIHETRVFHIFSIKTNQILLRKRIGQSIAVNGACMSIKKIKGKIFEFDAIPETLRKTNFGQLQKGSKVNLEGALKIGAALDGHIVQGHIDATGTVESFTEAKNRKMLKIKYPREIEKFLAQKGSISINGVSLTISEIDKNFFCVDLIPLTIFNTNLSELKKGDKVNLETDIIAKYLNSILNAKK